MASVNYKEVILSPDALMDFTFNFPWLTSVDDTIASVTFDAQAPLTATTQSFTSTSATVWLSWGDSPTPVLGQTQCTCTAHITTTGGRTDDLTGVIVYAQQ
jgi:hypothetical protein